MGEEEQAAFVDGSVGKQPHSARHGCGLDEEERKGWAAFKVNRRESGDLGLI